MKFGHYHVEALDSDRVPKCVNIHIILLRGVALVQASLGLYMLKEQRCRVITPSGMG